MGSYSTTKTTKNMKLTDVNWNEEVLILTPSGNKFNATYEDYGRFVLSENEFMDIHISIAIDFIAYLLKIANVDLVKCDIDKMKIINAPSNDYTDVLDNIDISECEIYNILQNLDEKELSRIKDHYLYDRYFSKAYSNLENFEDLRGVGISLLCSSDAYYFDTNKYIEKSLVNLSYKDAFKSIEAFDQGCTIREYVYEPSDIYIKKQYFGKKLLYFPIKNSFDLYIATKYDGFDNHAPFAKNMNELNEFSVESIKSVFINSGLEEEYNVYEDEIVELVNKTCQIPELEVWNKWNNKDSIDINYRLSKYYVTVDFPIQHFYKKLDMAIVLNNDNTKEYEACLEEYFKDKNQDNYQVLDLKKINDIMGFDINKNEKFNELIKCHDFFKLGELIEDDSLIYGRFDILFYDKLNDEVIITNY